MASDPKRRKCQNHHEQDVMYLCSTCRPNRVFCDGCFANDQSCVNAHRDEVLRINYDAIKDIKQGAEELQNYVNEYYLKDDLDHEIADIVSEARKEVERRYNEMLKAINTYEERAKRWLAQKRKAKMEVLKQKLHKYTSKVESINNYAISIQKRCDTVLSSHELLGYIELWNEREEVQRTLSEHRHWYRVTLREDPKDDSTIIQMTKDFPCRTEKPNVSIIPPPRHTDSFKVGGDAVKGVQLKRLSILHVHSGTVLVSFTAIEDIFVYNYKKGITDQSCEKHKGEGGIASAMLTKDSKFVVILTWKQPKKKSLSYFPIIIVHRGTSFDSKKFSQKELKKNHRIENPESLFMNSSGTVCLVDKVQGLFSIDRDNNKSTESWELNEILKPICYYDYIACVNMCRAVCPSYKFSFQLKPQWEFKAAVELSKTAFATDNNTSVACRRYWVVEEFVQYEQQSTQDYRIREYVVKDTREDGTQHDSEPTLLSYRDIDCRTSSGAQLPLRQCQLVTDGEDRVYLIGSDSSKQGQGQGQSHNQSRSHEQSQSHDQGQVHDQRGVHVFSTDGLYVGTILSAEQVTALAMDVDTKTLYVACQDNADVLAYTDVSARCQKLELQVMTAL